MSAAVEPSTKTPHLCESPGPLKSESQTNSGGKLCGDAALLKFTFQVFAQLLPPSQCLSLRPAPVSGSCHSFPKTKVKGQLQLAPSASTPLRMNSHSTRQHPIPAVRLTQACFHSGFLYVSCFHVLLLFSGVQVCLRIFLLPDKAHTGTGTVLGHYYYYHHYYVYSQKTLALKWMVVQSSVGGSHWDSEVWGRCVGGGGGTIG